jgi:hypothetical protein
MEGLHQAHQGNDTKAHLSEAKMVKSVRICRSTTPNFRVKKGKTHFIPVYPCLHFDLE